MDSILFGTSLPLHQYLLILAMCTIMVWYGQFAWKRIQFCFHVWNTPGPFTVPIIGHIYMFCFKDPMTAIMKILPELHQKYSPCCRLWIGFDLVFVVSSVEYSEEILNNRKSFNKLHIIYRFLTKELGDGMVTSTGSKWHKHRKLISPSFNQKMLNSFLPIFDKQSDILITVLIEKAGLKKVKLYHLLCKCTLDIICQTAMGVNLNVQTSEENLGELVEGLFELLAYRTFHPWLYNDFIWNLTAQCKKLNYYLKKFYEKIKFVMKTNLETRNELKRKIVMCSSVYFLIYKSKKDLYFDSEVEEKGTKKRTSILDLEDSELTEKEFQDEVNTFLLAGTETTASTLCFIFVVLGLFPDIQTNVYEEVMNIFGVDGPITTEGLIQMKYSERVIKETMRLFPITPLIGREVTEDLVVGDQVHPAGSGILMNIFMLHRNPKYWPDPLKFDPDRFLPEEVAKRNPYTYLAFSMGPRICIGWRYAMLNMKMILAKTVRNLKVYTDYKSIEEIDLVIHLILRMKDGPKIWMEKR